MTKPVGNRLCKKGRTAWSVLCVVRRATARVAPYAPMNDRIFVGGGGCPPSCQPIPGHCRARQSGHFLEIGSLLPPLAALRRFPRRPARLHFHIARRGRCPHRPVRCGFVGADNSVRPGPITQHLVGQGPCALPWVGKNRSGRCRHRPLRRGCKGCGGFLMARRGGRFCPPGDHLLFGGLLKTV